MKAQRRAGPARARSPHRRSAVAHFAITFGLLAVAGCGADVQPTPETTLVAPTPPSIGTEEPSPPVDPALAFSNPPPAGVDPITAGLATAPLGPTERVSWRGREVTVSRLPDGNYLYGSDIVINRDEVGTPGAAYEEEDGLVRVGQEVRIQGLGKMWKRNRDADLPGKVVIPYSFNTGISSLEASQIRAAMDHWSRLAPALVFRPIKGGDTQGILFNRHASLCSSNAGMQSTFQTINLAPRCIGNQSTLHEIGHALGLLHEHTRTDRNTHVNVQWGNIQGCPSTATQLSQCGSVCGTNATTIADCGCTAANAANGSCWATVGADMGVDNARADIYGYDFGSVMHYGDNAHTKNGQQTLVPVNGGTIPWPTGFSPKDADTIRALYPEVHIQPVLFANTGARPLCRLMGREEDTADRFTGSLSGIPLHTDTGLIATSRLAAGTTGTITCKVESIFWSSNYSYPNSTQLFNTARRIETYTSSATTVRVLSAGLIPLTGGIL